MTTLPPSVPEPFQALAMIVQSLDNRFPNGNDIFQRVARLCEESGELAKAVNHRENMGIKHDKYGDATNESLVHEVQDVLCAALAIATHYDLLDDLETAILQRYYKHQADNFNKA